MAERPARRLLAALVAVGALLAANRPALAQRGGPTERLVVEHAEQVQRLAQGDSVSYYLDGDVRARRGDLRLTAQHVVILDWLGIADFSRDVHIWDPDNELFADHVTYTDSTDVAVANGNVQIVDRESGSQLKSQQAVYDRPAGVLTATEKPEMLLLPTPEEGAPPDSAEEPIHVWARQVQLHRATEDIVATGEVLIRRGADLTAKADSVHFLRTAERVALRGKPRVETDRFYIEGREIDAAMPGQTLQSLLARGEAQATSRSDSIPAQAVTELGEASPSSWIAGDSLRVAFRDKAARSLDALGDARSLNYSLESRAGDASTWALSYLLAGHIRLVFDEGGEGLRRVEASQEGRGLYRTVALTGAEPDTARAAVPPVAAPSAAAPASAQEVQAADSAGVRPAGGEPRVGRNDDP